MHKFPLPTTRLILLLKLIILAVPLLGMAWLANQRYILTPVISYSFTAGSKPRAIAPETGDIIRTYNSNWFLNDDILKFTVRVPRLVESIRLRAVLVNRNQPIIRLTAGGNEEYGDQTRLIRHRTLDSLAWNRLESQRLHLWQRPERDIIQTAPGPDGKPIETVVGQSPVRQFGSVEEFLTDLPPASSFATVELDPLAFSFVSNYQPAHTPNTIPPAFRGSHTLYVYAADEDLRLRFEKVDLNRQAGRDPLVILVRTVSLDPNDRKLLMKKTVADDGSEAEDNVHGQAQTSDIVLTNVPAAMYRIEFLASDDVLIRNILSDQHCVVFTGDVFLADGSSYRGTSPAFRPWQLRSNSPDLAFKTKHPEGIQRIFSGDKSVELTGVGPTVNLTGLPPGATVDLERADLIVSSPGMLAFGSARLPEFPPVAFSDSTDLEPFDYLISGYFPRPTTGRVLIDETFEFRRLLLTTNELHFQLEFPGLGFANHMVELQTIKATLRRGAFPWDKIPDKLFGIFQGA